METTTTSGRKRSSTKASTCPEDLHKGREPRRSGLRSCRELRSSSNLTRKKTLVKTLEQSCDEEDSAPSLGSGSHLQKGSSSSNDSPIEVKSAENVESYGGKEARQNGNDLPNDDRIGNRNEGNDDREKKKRSKKQIPGQKRLRGSKCTNSTESVETCQTVYENHDGHESSASIPMSSKSVVNLTFTSHSSSQNAPNCEANSSTFQSKSRLSSRLNQIKSRKLAGSDVEKVKAVNLANGNVTDGEGNAALKDLTRETGMQQVTSKSMSPAPEHLKTNSTLSVNETNLAVEAPRHIWPRLCNDSESILHYMRNRAAGKISCINKRAMEDAYISSPLKDFGVEATEEPSKTRVTTIDWHPKKADHITIGGKHGDIVFYRVDHDLGWDLKELSRIAGSGPGGYISALKYDPFNDDNFYTSSLNGQVCLRSAETGDHLKTLLNTHTWDNWFTSLDVHKTESYVVSGHSNGWVYLQSKWGQTVSEKRLHRGKVSHAEFSPCHPSLLCTASLDHTVRMWDIRMLNAKDPLHTFHFDKGINSAYFSLTDGCRLLVTDQYDEFRIYQGPLWRLEQTIKHPHRFFQHLTPIKGYWHPLKDLVVCGRYPDHNFPSLGDRRPVDVIDAGSGKYLCEMEDYYFPKIVSLCKFNRTGELLLTSMGFKIQLWARPLPLPEEMCSEKERDQLSNSRQNPSWGPSVGLWERTSGVGDGGATARMKTSWFKSDWNKLMKRARAKCFSCNGKSGKASKDKK